MMHPRISTQNTQISNFFACESSINEEYHDFFLCHYSTVLLWTSNLWSRTNNCPIIWHTLFICWGIEFSNHWIHTNWMDVRKLSFIDAILSLHSTSYGMQNINDDSSTITCAEFFQCNLNSQVVFHSTIPMRQEEIKYT